MQNDEKKSFEQAEVILPEEKLDGVSGGQWSGRYPGSACPLCNRPLIDTGLVDPRGVHASMCTHCNQCFQFWDPGTIITQ